MSLKTDYKDFELAPDMGGKRRYKMINNDDGTVSFVDVSEYLEIGDTFKADDINATNNAGNRLDNALTTINSEISKRKIIEEANQTRVGITGNNTTSYWDVVHSNLDTHRLWMNNDILGYQLWGDDGSLKKYWQFNPNAIVPISDAYNTSKTYAQSEFCIYNNTLWKSKVASNLNHEPTEGSYWTETKIGNEVSTSIRWVNGAGSSLNDCLNNICSKIEVFIPYFFIFTVGVRYVGYIMTYQKSATPANAMAMMIGANGSTYKCVCNNGTWTTTAI